MPSKTSAGEDKHGWSRPAATVAVLAAGLLWSIGGLAVKQVTGPLGQDPGTVAMLRSFSAAMVLVPFAPRGGYTLGWREGATGLCFAGVAFTFVAATTLTTAANAVFLEYFSPLAISIGGYFLLGERLRKSTIAGVVVAAGGVVVILLGSWQGADRTGVLLGLGCAAAGTGFSLLQRASSKGHPLSQLVTYNVLAGALLIPLGLDGLHHVSLAAAGFIVLMAGVQLVLPYGLYMQGLKTLSAGEAALICMVEPLLNPVWVWLVLGEAPSGWTIAGGGLILAGLAFHLTGVVRRRASRRRSERRNPGAYMPGPGA